MSALSEVQLKFAVERLKIVLFCGPRSIVDDEPDRTNTISNRYIFL